MPSRNTAETAVPISPPTALKRAAVERGGGQRDADAGEDHDGGVAEREEEAGRDGPLVLLHELADDVVDGGDVVGVHRMADAENIGEKRGAQQRRAVREEKPRPSPS